MKEIMFWLFKDPVNSGLDQFDHAQSVKNGLKVKKIKLPQMNFFLEKQLTNHYYYFHLPIGPFHCAKL